MKENYQKALSDCLNRYLMYPKECYLPDGMIHKNYIGLGFQKIMKRTSIEPVDLTRQIWWHSKVFIPPQVLTNLANTGKTGLPFSY